MAMKHVLMFLATGIFIGSAAFAQAADLGAQIAAADAALGARPGEIPVTASGTISEGEVSLSVGHDLVCSNQATISLNAGSYLYQNSHTSIRNCIISSTATPISGEVQSINTDNVVLDGVTFIGGGNLVNWSGVTDFRISNNTVVSITAVDSTMNATTAGYYLFNCSHGQIDNFAAGGFVFPAGENNTAILELNLSSYITINNPVIQNVDASYVHLGAGAIELNGSTHIVVHGGTITGNSNTDGILSESFGNNVSSSHLTITGLNASYNGGVGLNTAAPLGLGDGLDLINTSHIFISHCTLDGDGSLHDEQPAIWLFLDDDVLVADSDLSDGSMAGIATAGSPNVRLLRDTINRNQATGVFTEWQGGTATNVGPAVTFAAGVSGGFGLSWLTGTLFILDGVTYHISSVTDSKHLTLTTAPPDHSSPAAWGVNTTQEIRDSTIDDNGLGGFGGQIQVGISWADGTTGTISGVTSTNTGVGAQLYGLELANTASVALDNDNFSGNVNGGNGIQGGLLTVSVPSLTFPSQEVASTSAAQTITVTAGAIVVQNLVIVASDNFSQTNNCGTGLPAFGTCQVVITFTPSAAGAVTGTLVIAGSDPNNPQTISLTGTAVSPGLGLSVATGGFNSATVAAGSTAKYSLSIGGAGMSGTAFLSCTGAPAAATCNLPATEALSPTQATPFAVSVMTVAPTMGALRQDYFRSSRWLWALSIGWVVLPAGLSKKRKVRRRLLSLPLLLLMFLCSCGGDPRSARGTPAGQYTLTVTAKVGNASEQTTLMLTVK
ncbi:MAG TPA: hypothetical protein VI386_19675 [Candidatus Sulfotelmatobacter sp.]